MKTKSFFAALILLSAGSALQAQTTFTWGAPTTGTWENGVAFGAGAAYVNELTLANGSIANFGSLSGTTAASVNGTVEAYQLGHLTTQLLTLNVGTGTPLIRLGAGGISQNSSSIALTINTGIEVTTAQSWGLTAVNTFAGAITGSGNLSISTGNSRGLIWSNASGNTYNGTIKVTAGQLYTTQTLGFQNATLDTTGAAGTTSFRFSQATNTIGGLQGNVGLLLSRKNNATEATDRGGMTLSIGNNNSDTTFSGDITQGASASAITKIGNGTQTFSGTNSYTGATTVSAGTLLVNGSLAAGSNAMVSGGAEFGRSVLSSLSMGNATSTTTFADNSRIVLALDAGLAHASLNRTGGLWSFDSNQAFRFMDLGGATTGLYTGIITGLAGTEVGLSTIGTTWSIVNDGWSGTFSYSAGSVDLNLVVIPEPSSWALLVGSLTVLVVLRRVRRA